MVQKRPFDDEESYEISSKHPKQVEHSNQLVSFSESVFPVDASSHITHTSGDDKFGSDIIMKLPISSQENETSFPGCISFSSWATSGTSEEDTRSEAPLHISFLPHYFSPKRPISTLSHCGDIYSILLDCPPQKSVPVGPSYQADVPEWGLCGTKHMSSHSDTSDAVSNLDLTVGEDDEKKLIGTCVIPMPNSELLAYDGDKVGNGRTDCGCGDDGSVRCVGQHIMEVREKLKITLGEERFVKLGFCDMGEQVAEKWSDEEEQLFHEVVFSNPASSGKNFWETLSVVFPTRTKKDIVSYYFNVFMLQRRAEQNRDDPMNIDSDDDEWQGNDDYGDNELGMVEEDEDSVVESPVHGDDPGQNQKREDDLCEYDEDVADADDDVDCGTCRAITSISDTCPRKLLDYCSSNPTFHLQDEVPWDDRRDQEVQDDSCTSSETGAASHGTQMKADNGDYWQGSDNGLGTGCGHGYALEPCDAKVWDAWYMTCPKKNEVDFLPTCMIEEVFGDGSWSYTAKDGKGMS